MALIIFVSQEYLRFLVTYHRFLSFTLYCIGFVWFVLSLVKKYYMKQFSLFAWTHVALLIVVTQSYLIIQNIFEGILNFSKPNVINSTLNLCLMYRSDLVYCTGIDDRMQRRNGIFVRFLFWPNATHKAQPKEDVGRIYWRRYQYCNLWCTVLILPKPVSVLCVPH